MLQTRCERYGAYRDKNHGNQLQMSATKHCATNILSDRIFNASGANPLCAREDPRFRTRQLNFPNAQKASTTYAYLLAMPPAEIIPLVLTAILASIPVALPTTCTVAAALGARALARLGVLPTRLSAVDEAATIDVLCADKTGTLTLNELTVAAVRPAPGFDEAAALRQAQMGIAVSTATDDHTVASIGKFELAGYYWRRRSDSNRCMEVLQTSPLTTWVRRPASVAVATEPIQLSRAAKRIN